MKNNIVAIISMLVLALPATAQEKKPTILDLELSRDMIQAAVANIANTEITDAEVEIAGDKNLKTIIDAAVLADLKLDMAIEQLGGEPKFKLTHDLLPRIESSLKEDLK